MARETPRSAESVVNIATSFEVGRHVVRVTKVMEGRWSVTVDGGALDSSYRTQADAWEAGVRESDRLDKLAPR
jgi:hypothetical protein